AKHYSQTLEGLAENYRFLSSDESKFFIQHTAEKQIWSEKNALILENKILEQKYYQDAEYLALQRRNKLLQYERDIFELREELNQKSVFSATEAQAKILEHLNRNTKSKTDIFADSFISAFDKIASHADKMLDKSGIGKIPILGDIAKAQSRNMLSDFTRGTLGKIFPELSKQLEKTGNPQLDEAKTQTQILKSIDSKIGGGSSIFDTSTRPRIVQQAIGAVTGGGLFGGANSANPMIYHAGQPRGVMGDFRGQAAGLQEYLGGGGGSIIDRIKGIFGTGEGGLFAARKNLLTGKMSKGGGYGAGIGSLMSMAGGLVGGRWGNALSMAGQGAQFGAMFGGWGALIGGGIGGAIGLFKALRGGGDSKKKLKQAVQTAYGITVNDDSVLSQLESIGKAYFGGVAGNENKIIATDEARYIIESFASRSGQSLSKLNAGKITDENWSGNNFGLPFHGYSQATARTSVSSIINQRRPELTATMNFGSSAPGHSSTSSNALSEKIENALQMVADMCVVNTEMTQTFIETVKSMPAGEVLTIGARQRPDVIADAYESELGRGSSRTEALIRKMGMAY
ncbi:MAG TPA: hypothetical protein VK308_03480, partial [Pyrinomonadaceae bacterium]|nr:hypothetical protein [Pyrinomonadaceae bacterium]